MYNRKPTLLIIITMCMCTQITYGVTNILPLHCIYRELFYHISQRIACAHQKLFRMYTALHASYIGSNFSWRAPGTWTTPTRPAYHWLDDYNAKNSMSLWASGPLVVFLLQKPPFVMHYHKQLVQFYTKNSLVVVYYACAYASVSTSCGTNNTTVVEPSGTRDNC